jgi:hypothetical protein
MIRLKNILNEEQKLNRLYYFAFGSNMDVYDFEKKYKTAKALRLVKLDGFELVFDKFSENDNSTVSDIVPEKNHHVIGILYKIDGSEIPKLDKQEGGYKKEFGEATDAVGNKYDVFYYTVQNKTKEKQFPKSSYVVKLLAGLKQGWEMNPDEHEPMRKDFDRYLHDVKVLFKKSEKEK